MVVAALAWGAAAATATPPVRTGSVEVSSAAQRSGVFAALGWDDSTAFVSVADGDGASIRRMNVRTRAVMAGRLPVSGQVRAILPGAAPGEPGDPSYAYALLAAADGQSSRLLRFDADRLSEADDVSIDPALGVGTAATAIPGRKRAFVATAAVPSALVRVDLASMQVTRSNRSAVDAPAATVAPSADGSMVYLFTKKGAPGVEPTVRAYDAGSLGAITPALGLDGRQDVVAASPDPRTGDIVAATADGAVIRITTTTDSEGDTVLAIRSADTLLPQLGALPRLMQPGSLAVEGSGRDVYYAVGMAPPRGTVFGTSEVIAPGVGDFTPFLPSGIHTAGPVLLDSGGVRGAVASSQPTVVVSTFDLVPRAHRLTVSASGGGSVVSSPAGISCGTDCATDLPRGSTTRLIAIPAPGMRLAGWSGDCSGDDDDCVVTMTGPRTVSASFAPIARRTLSITITGSPDGRVTSYPLGISCTQEAPAGCSATFLDGDAIVLSAGSADGRSSRFRQWGASCSGTGGTCTLTMNQDRTVNAEFTDLTPPPVPAITVTRAGRGSGTVTSVPSGIECGPRCTAEFPGLSPFAQATLTADPAPGSTFAGWTGSKNCGVVATCQLTLQGRRAVTATFEATPPPPTQQMLVATGGDGSGMVISSPAGITCGPGTGGACAATFATGSTVTLKVAPAAGSVFNAWSGACAGGALTCTVQMDAVQAVTAAFMKTVQPDPGPTPTPPEPKPAPVNPLTPDPAPDPPPPPSPVPAPGPNPPAPDPAPGPALAPQLSQLRVRPASFRPRGGATVTYRLNAPAGVTLTFRHASGARPRYVVRLPRGAAGGDAGLNRVRLAGRVRSRDVRAGRWTMQVTAANDQGRTRAFRRVITVRPRR